MGRKRIVKPELDERREERMRPSRFLGYDRDSLGAYALSREMLDVAESQFRRAVYLNPYEPRFTRHLAWCLHRQGRDEEAVEWIHKSLVQKPDDRESRYVEGRIRARIGGGAPRSGED